MLHAPFGQYSLLFTGYECLMDALREYVAAIAAAALLSGVLIRLTQKTAGGGMIRMLCGLFMTIVLIRPISANKEHLLEAAFPDYSQQANIVVSEGTAEADNMKQEFIKQRVRTYILSRAEALDADLQVRVSLAEDGTPASVRITGNISPMNKSRLTQMIALELGIPKERQEWNG